VGLLSPPYPPKSKVGSTSFDYPFFAVTKWTHFRFASFLPSCFGGRSVSGFPPHVCPGPVLDPRTCVLCLVKIPFFSELPFEPGALGVSWSSSPSLFEFSPRHSFFWAFVRTSFFFFLYKGCLAFGSVPPTRPTLKPGPSKSFFGFLIAPFPQTVPLPKSGVGLFTERNLAAVKGPGFSPHGCRGQPADTWLFLISHGTFSVRDNHFILFPRSRDYLCLPFLPRGPVFGGSLSTVAFVRWTVPPPHILPAPPAVNSFFSF